MMNVHFKLTPMEQTQTLINQNNQSELLQLKNSEASQIHHKTLFLAPIKYYMISQNVKKFANKLLQKIQYLKLVQKKHLLVIHDRGASVKSNQFIQKNYLDFLLQNDLTKKKRETYFEKKLKRFQRKIAFTFNKYCFLKVITKAISRTYEKYIPIIQPDSFISKFILNLMLFIRFIYIAIIPLQLAFNKSLLMNDFYIPNIIFQLLLFFEILLNFTKATYKDGQLVKTRGLIYKLYLKGNFGIDFISLLSLFIPTVIQDDQNLSSIILLIFWIQFKTLLEFREETQEHNRQRKHLIKFVSLLLQILFAEHLFSCIFYGLSIGLDKKGEEITFFSKYLKDLSWERQYVETFYFSATTMITVGYGDLSPQNTYEKIMLIFFMLISSIQLSYSVNTIGTIISEINKEKKENQTKIRLVTAYMENKNITPKLQLNIREYLKHFWREQELEQKFQAQQKIISQLPEHLKEKLFREVNNEMLINCPIFQRRNFTKDFYNQVSKIIVEINLLPEQLISNEKQNLGIKGPCLYFVDKGEIQAIAPTGNKSVEINKYVQGEYFGINNFLCDSEQKIIFKSLKFSRIFLIPRFEFLQQISNEDKEIFMMIKDDYTFSLQSMYKPLCSACLNVLHSLEKCPYIHFIADPEKIIKQYCFPSISHRIRFLRFKRLRNLYCSIIDQDFISDCSLAYRKDNMKLLQNAYDEDVSSDSSQDDEVKSVDDQQSKNSEKSLVKIIESDEDELESEKQIKKPEKKQLPKMQLHYLPDLAEIPEEEPQIQRKLKVTQSEKVFQKFLDLKQKSMPQKKKKIPKQKRFSARLEIFNIGQKIIDFNKNEIPIQKVNQKNIDTKQKKHQNLQRKSVFFDERLMLGQLEKQKYLYEGKMSEFLRKQDLVEQAFLLIRLRIKYINEINEDFDAALNFQNYKKNDNLQNIIERVNYKASLEIQQHVDKLRHYLFYPYNFICQYRYKSPQLVTPERTDQSQNNFHRKRSHTRTINRQIFSTIRQKKF